MDELVNHATTQEVAELTRRLVVALYLSASMSKRSSDRLEFYTRWLIVLTVAVVVVGAITVAVAA